MVDNRIRNDQVMMVYNKYDPKEDPLNQRSPSIPAIFSRLTGE